MEACMETQIKMAVVNIFLMVGVSIFYIAASFLYKHISKSRLKSFKESPAVPVNFLDGYENRCAYAMAFGVATSMIVNILLSTIDSNGTNTFQGSLKIFIQLLQAALISLMPFPLVDCIGVKKLHGAICGLAYSILWLLVLIGVNTEITRKCDNILLTTHLHMLWVGRFLPMVICLLVLTGHFLRKIFKFLKCRFRFYNEGSDTDRYAIQYVSRLLKKKRVAVKGLLLAPPALQRMVDFIRYRIYPPQPEFKFSTRFVCTMAVSFIAVYQVMVYSAVLIKYYISIIFIIIPSAKIGSDAPIAGAIIVSGVRSLLVGINASKWHRNYLMRLRLGDREWLPPSLKTFDSCPMRVTIGSLKFSGFQIAYSAFNNLFVTIMLFSIFIVIHAYGGSLLLSVIKSYWPYFLSMFGVWLAQRLLVKYAFIQKKGGLVAIIRRRGFNHVSYFFFFFNSLLGIVSYFLRLVTGLLLGLVFLERTQKSLIPRSFERFDRGYVSYLSYLHVEHTFGNPVLVVFVKLLNLSTQWDEFGKIQNAYVVENVTGRDAASLDRYRLARNRWYLAYTLIKNPALIPFRGKNMPVATAPTASEKDVTLNI